MGNRELEVVLLLKIKEMNNAFQIVPFEDLRLANGKLKVPRCIARTLFNRVSHKYDSQKEEKEKVVVFYQTNINHHLVSLNFTGAKFEEVVKIRDFFSNKVSVQWWKLRNDLDIVIEEVGDLKNITDHNSNDTIERYVMDIVIRTKTKLETEIEIIKKVDFEVKGGS